MSRLLKGLSQKRVHSITFNYIYLPEMMRPRFFYPAVTLRRPSLRARQHSITVIHARLLFSFYRGSFTHV